MTVEKLIEMLKAAKLTDHVYAYDADSEQEEPVTGMIYGSDDGKVVLQTDRPF